MRTRAVLLVAIATVVVAGMAMTSSEPVATRAAAPDTAERRAVPAPVARKMLQPVATSTTTTPPPPPTTTTTTPAPVPALCIGDSVMLGAGPPYQNTLAMCGVVDAAENRQLSAGADVAAAHAGAVPLPPTVVVGLGTNGPTSAAEIDALLAVLAGVPRVVLVTVQLGHTRDWQDGVNAELRAAPDRHPGRVVIADWEAASNGHPEWFAGDGVHISANPAGAQAYAAVIAAAL